MPNYILKELNKELTDGKKVVFPKMQTYSQHDFETVLKHMHTYAGNFSEGTMRAVIDALVETMKSWMPMGHSMKIDGLGTFSLSLGFKDKDTDEDPKTKYRHICIKGINFKPDAKLIAAERLRKGHRTMSQCGLQRPEAAHGPTRLAHRHTRQRLAQGLDPTGITLLPTPCYRKVKAKGNDFASSSV